ncbi:MAG: LPS assembly lipoprotein LptE [Cyclobacteriaceae bacterium]|nr:LPS assembly lipoprotein LptE [Cyclobacteriaceae bacterium]MDH4295617.1 LPS assembly lipoprotein LptE [Cyclobacteriaceae bacterium]MDH5248979.1 LPS assembly lipoprotein LptE [Cyclobacteriaceae bacterium]
MKIKHYLDIVSTHAWYSSGTALTIRIASLLVFTSCGVSVNYSMSGMSTSATTISIYEFYNNADLGPANMGQTLTNQLKNYFIQNSSIAVVADVGELQLEGEITDFKLTPIAPTATGDPNAINRASSTRLTISVKATYVNTLDEAMNFKDKTFSFYKDFPNDQNITDVEELYTKQIFERIVNDIFNASVANW